MSYKGMDVEAVRGLARHMHHSGGDIHSVIATLTSELASLPWYGPDRDTFDRHWASHVQHLAGIVQALNAAALAAERKATQQEDLSTGHHR